MVNPRLVPDITQTLTYQRHSPDLDTTLFPRSPELARQPATGLSGALYKWPALKTRRQVTGDDQDSVNIKVSRSPQAPAYARTTLTITLTGPAHNDRHNGYTGQRLPGVPRPGPLPQGCDQVLRCFYRHHYYPRPPSHGCHGDSTDRHPPEGR